MVQKCSNTKAVLFKKQYGPVVESVLTDLPAV